jgi:hypothetical protein
MVRAPSTLVHMSAGDTGFGSAPITISCAPTLPSAGATRRFSVLTCLVAFAVLQPSLHQLGLFQSPTSNLEHSSVPRPPGLLSGTSQDMTMQPGFSEQLKAFLAAPPPLEMLVEVRESSPRTNAYYVLLRYQTNALFYREAPTLAALSSPSLSPGFRGAGYYGEEYWSFSYDGGTFGAQLN